MPIAKRKRRRRDATDDDDDGSGPEWLAEHVAAEHDVVERVALDDHRVAPHLFTARRGLRRHGGHASGMLDQRSGPDKSVAATIVGVMADGSPLAHSPTVVASSPHQKGDDDDELASGTAVGEYVVERFLGAGAMGEVYAGKQPVIGKKVAIKVLKREVAASPDGAERFMREARAVNQVDHPDVIDIFSFGRLAGRAALPGDGSRRGQVAAQAR